MNSKQRAFTALQSFKSRPRSLAHVGAALAITAAWLATAPMQALANIVTFNYVKSISNPPAPDEQLGLNPSIFSPWATVILDDGFDLDDGLFRMLIEAKFDPAPPDTSTPSITQLAFNINGFASLPASNPLFSFAAEPFCSPNSPASTTTCDGTFSIDYGLDNVGVVGAGASNLNKKGFDLLINLPPPGVKLDVSQGMIELLIQGPPSFSVDSFASACSNGATPSSSGACPAGSYATVAKVQELINNGSTVIAGVGEDGEIPPDVPEERVPAPLPFLGATTALALSRRFRHRQRQHRATCAADLPS